MFVEMYTNSYKITWQMYEESLINRINWCKMFVETYTNSCKITCMKKLRRNWCTMFVEMYTNSYKITWQMYEESLINKINWCKMFVETYTHSYKIICMKKLRINCCKMFVEMYTNWCFRINSSNSSNFSILTLKISTKACD